MQIQKNVNPVVQTEKRMKKKKGKEKLRGETKRKRRKRPIE